MERYNYDEITQEREQEEEEDKLPSELFEIKQQAHVPAARRETTEIEVEGSSLFSFDVNKGSSNFECVYYVGVGKGESTLDALSWTLRKAVKTSSAATVYLIHVFPEIHHVPSPLGKLPKSQVGPAQLENFMAQERDKRTQLLQNYISLCSASKVNVETVLIESDNLAKTLLDLIPILDIKRLVIGTSKSTLRKLRSKKGVGSGIADQILQNTAPHACEINIICQGKEVSEQLIGSSPHLLNPPQQSTDSFTCNCFKPPKVL